MCLLKKTSTLFLFFVLCSQSSNAQRFSNHWINQDKPYAKIKVDQTGFYEFTVAEVATALPNIYSVNGSRLKMYADGAPITIEVVSATEQLKAEDKIRFYGKKNDGKRDYILYRPVTAQPHTYTSLYTDISTYFLTIAEATETPLRVSLETPAANETPKIISTEQHEYRKVYDSDFTFNSVTGPVPFIQQSYFEIGEGYTGPRINANQVFKHSIPLTGNTGTSVTVELLLNGRNSTNRKINIKVGAVDTVISLNGYQHKQVNLNVLSSSNASLPVEITSTSDYYSVTYIRAFYQSEPTVAEASGEFNFLTADTYSSVAVQGPNHAEVRLLNITNPYNITEATRSATTDVSTFELKGRSKINPQTYFYTKSYLKPLSIEPFQTSNTYNDLANLLIVSSKKLAASTQQYAEYKTSKLGGGFNVETVYIEDLYDEFYYGIKSPLAIRNYLTYKLKIGQPEFLLLIGKAFSTYTGRDSPDNLVPSIGYPASDILLSSGINTHEDVPGIATGRIPALTDEEVLIYLDKLKQNDVKELTKSRKDVIHLSGGKNQNEIENFGQLLDDVAVIAESSDLGISILSKRKPVPTGNLPANVVKEINEGVSLISFMGHSSYQTLDFDVGFVSKPELGYANSQYPIFYFNGCAFVNYYREIPTISADWIFAPNKGAIGIIGQTYFGYQYSLERHTREFYTELFNNQEELPVGKLLQNVAGAIANYPNYSLLDVLNNTQTLLLGDPTVRIFGFDLPDFQIDTANYLFEETADSLNFTLKIENNGRLSNHPFIKVKTNSYGLLVNEEENITIPTPNEGTELTIGIKKTPYFNRAIVTLDPENDVNEENESNNIFIYGVDSGPVTADKEPPLLVSQIDQKDPYEYMQVSNTPTLDIFLHDNKPYEFSADVSKYLNVFIKTCDTCDYEKLDLNAVEHKVYIEDSSTITLSFYFPELAEGTYELIILAYDESRNFDLENPYQLSFVVNNAIDLDSYTVNVYPNPAFECVNFHVKNIPSNVNGILQMELFQSDGKLIEQWESELKGGNSTEKWCYAVPGKYIYRITVKEDTAEPKVFTGQVFLMR